ncbi:MAPEG family protein [Sulfidibacter corallicola]
MNPTGLALIGYIAWLLLLVTMLVLIRATCTLTGKKAANDFNPNGLDVSPFSGRLCRAHANCYESFPFIGGLLMVALATDATRITDGLALPLLAARLTQSSIHLISTSELAVTVRFILFFTQIAICLWWSWRFAVLFLG